MSVSRKTHLITTIIIMLFLVPPLPSPTVSGGSAWSASGPGLHNGTVENATCAPQGIGLPLNGTYLNNWTRMDPWPTARDYPNMVYDRQDGVMILFGGTEWLYHQLNDTWTYNLSTNSWRNMSSPNAPPADSPCFQMVYDSTNGVVILFETSYASPQGNTWTYNLTANTWTKLNPFPAPAGRAGASMCFDSKNGVVVYFGGTWGGGRNDTWTFNLSTNLWTQMSPQVTPSQRAYAAMDFDPVSGKAILFGGSTDTADDFLNDTWAYDFRTDNWTNLTPAKAPSTRWLENANMKYDSVRRKMVLHGGVEPGWAYLNDTWAYDYSANNWTNISAANSPSIRPYAAVAYDDRNGGMVLFGGSGEYIFWDDTWLLNSTTNNWTKKKIVPYYRGASNIVYDDRHGQYILFGGAWSWPPFNDTWTYDPARNSWTEKHPSRAPAYATSYDGYLMVFDSASGVAMAFGSYDRYTISCTWTYNLTADSWTYMNPTVQPCQRSGMVMAYDSQNNATILFGGATPSCLLNDTWVYDYPTNTWTDRKPARSPPLRFGGSMVYDKRDGVMILFGGYNQTSAFVNETWTYNFTTNNWTNMRPATSPGTIENFNLVFDDASGKAIMFGGIDNSRSYPWLNETWAYDYPSNSWTRLAPVRTPYYPISNAGMACDGRNGTVILFGGSGPSTAYDDTWAFNLSRYVSPGGYASPPVDTGGSAYYGNLAWQGDLPANTSIKFQLRTAGSSAALNSSEFAGPDGTNATYYNASGPRIAGIHNGSRWMQYKAYLQTSNPAYTPVLRNVTIRFNLIHSFDIIAPAGGETWNGTQNITWSASDPDGDRLFIDIHMLNGTQDSVLAQNIPAQNQGWQWDTSSTPNGTYRLILVAKDDNLSIPLSVNRTTLGFTVFHPHINEAPSLELLLPADNSTFIVHSVNLSWNCSDPESDSLFCHVFLQNASFDAGNLPPAVANTTDSFYEANGLDNGTYFWTVMAFDGKVGSNIPPVRRFTIAIPEPNHIPRIGLVAPVDNATINVSSAVLSWGASDDENDSLTFSLEYSDSPFGSGTPTVISLNDTSYQLSNLTDGTTIYWRVTVSDGKDNASSDIRHFTILLPVPNHPPVITSTPGLNATVNETYFYNITGSDPDNDTLAFEIVTFPTGMSINGSTGRLQWIPGQKGNFTVLVRVLDGKGGADGQTFNISVTKKEIVVPVVRLSCTISSLSSGQKVSKQLTIQGSAAAENSTIAAVQVRVDGGNWTNATGKTGWSFMLDTTALKNGIHTIFVRTTDGANYSEVKSVDVQVKNAVPSPGGGEGGFPPWIAAIVIVLAAVGVIAFAATRKKKVVPPAEEEAPEAVEKEETEKEASEAKKPLEPEQAARKAGAAMAPPAIAAPAKAAPSEPTVPPVPAKIAPEGFAINDIFLMFIDGRLILHTTRRIRADMDADIMASMLTAVQAFVKDSIGMESGTELGAMEYGDNKILLHKGKHVVIAAVIEGTEPADFRDEMRHTASNIEGEFGPVLASWDGMTNKLAGARKFLSQLGDYKAATVAVPEKAKTDISLKGELEFYQGFVRLKVAVKNNMDTVITKSTFKLLYNDQTLRLDHLEPDYERKGEEVVLGVIEPKEKKTIGFYLDPQICTESFLEGVLTFKDARGNLETMKMPRKMASVVCPIMYTEENINTAMLKRMAADELDKKDTKVFAVPPALAPETAFDLAEAAVQHHDVRLVREFTEEKPFVGEAWYYGKAKGREDRLVVRARVLGEKNVLEFFVASSSTLMLTGMLAELKADLNKELAAQRGAPEMKQVTAAEEVDAVATVRTLLDKAAELEQAAGETEVK